MPESANGGESESSRGEEAFQTEGGGGRRRRRTTLLVVLVMATAVVIAVAAWAVLNRPVAIPACDFGFGEVGASVAREDTNWSVTFGSFVRGRLPGNTSLGIRERFGAIVLPRTAWSNLTPGNWTSYHVVYEDNRPWNPEICPGDRLLLDWTLYPWGSEGTIWDERGGLLGGFFLA